MNTGTPTMSIINISMRMARTIRNPTLTCMYTSRSSTPIRTFLTCITGTGTSQLRDPPSFLLSGKFGDSLPRIGCKPLVLEHFQTVRLLQAQSVDFNQGAFIDLVGVPGVFQDIGSQRSELAVKAIVGEAEVGQVHCLGLSACI